MPLITTISVTTSTGFFVIDNGTDAGLGVNIRAYKGKRPGRPLVVGANRCREPKNASDLDL
jgi:hypothetical protein